MKLVQLLIILCVFAYKSNAQTNKEPELTKEQKWQLEWTTAFLKQKGENASSNIFLNNFKNLLASGILCKNPATSITALQADGDRISTETAFITLDVTNGKKDDSYIIERRYNSPKGQYDSVGVITLNETSVNLSRFRFTDNNDYPGKTWYRIRLLGSSDEKKLVCIKGYENTVTVFPNPATSSSLSVQLRQFKTDDNTTLTVSDAMGRPVYIQAKAFMKNATSLQLQTPKLSSGTYYIKVANQFNTGSTAFVVQ